MSTELPLAGCARTSSCASSSVTRRPSWRTWSPPDSARSRSLPTRPDRTMVRRRASAMVVLMAATLGLAAMIPGAVAAPTKAPRQLLFVAVPDLRWTDLPTMPTLRALMNRGAVGVLSVRSEGESTRCGDGLLEISAGTRVPSGVRSCDIDGATLFRLRARYRQSRYGAKLGLLGDSLGRVTSGYVGPAATMMANSRGLPSYDPLFGGSPSPDVT